jgi:hypothetical protein
VRIYGTCASPIQIRESGAEGVGEEEDKESHKRSTVEEGGVGDRTSKVCTKKKAEHMCSVLLWAIHASEKCAISRSISSTYQYIIAIFHISRAYWEYMNSKHMN